MSWIEWGFYNGKVMLFFIFLSSTVARLALGPSQPSAQWVLGFLPRGQSCQGLKLPTNSHLLLLLRMGGSIPVLSLYVFMA